MLLVETTERECCEYIDLVQLTGDNPNGSLMNEYGPFKFCKHCGRWFAYRSYTDAAGDTDYEYAPIHVTKWEFA